MNLNEIALFLRVIEHPSLGAAARALGMSKSTISRRIAQLEARLGVRLLDRTPTRVKPTEAGALYAEQHRGWLAQTEEAETAVRSLSTSPKGRVRVTAPVDLGAALLGPVTSEFLERCPEVTLDLFLTDAILDLVTEGFDLAIRTGTPSDDSVVARKLGTTRGMLCASPGYLARFGAPRAPEDLTAHRTVAFSSPSHDAEWTLTGPAGAVTTVRMAPRLCVNNMVTARDAAVAGLGIARLGSFICCDEMRDGRLVPVLPEWALEERPIYVIYPGRRKLTAKVRVFLDFVVARLRPAPPF